MLILFKITGDDKHINLAMKILYHLSMDDRVKLMFTQSDCVKLVRSYAYTQTDLTGFNFIS